ncbi:serine-rich adhesin for platelets-like isoform X5 [Homarus americanus]|uniref:serine-rich adhesin for platelets-like isoform X5 n=1 Tax=Homarus americanus TaxID=6706 RepID=UPI001C48C005|nr:serine-rich adhesin for platelets-like isoform X5 [Homarus americanus]
MLGCCNSYGRSHVDGMEGTEALRIQGHSDPLTHPVDSAPVKETSLDNRELENLNKREMRTNKHSNNKISEVDAASDNPDDGCEKNDSTKDEDYKTEEEWASDPLDPPRCLDLSTKSAESGEVDDVSCSEENSVDNNTFNIINTENSESQEISELTNDESHKEHGEDGHVKENGEYDRGTQTDEDSEEELSCLEEEDEDDDEEGELTEDSGESDCEDLTSRSDDGDESDDEAEFDNDSLEDGKSKKEEVMEKVECKVPKTLPLPLPPPSSPPQSAVAGVKGGDHKPSSPKIRQRLRSFGKKDTSEFKIEIFESKRKPQDIPSINVPDEAVSDSAGVGKARSDSGSVSDGKDPLLAPVTREKCIDQLATANVPSPCSDLTTPESADNTLGVSLDVSQAIREETDESDRCSPMKSPADVNTRTQHSAAGECVLEATPRYWSTDLTDTECKAAIEDNTSTEEPHITSALTSTTSAINTSTTSSSTTDSHHNPNSSGGGQQDGVEGQEVSTIEPKKPLPMAFTIELGDAPGGGGGGVADLSVAKKLDITASISKWAPKHRRNLSLTKVEEHKVVENFFDENGNSRAKRRSTISRLDVASLSQRRKVEERSGKPPVGRPRSGTIGATGLQQGRRGGGYHSEGYFSSDQDDEGPRRTDLKSPHSPRTPELRSPQTPQRLVRSSSQDSAKGASLRMRTPSPDNASRASHAMTLNESASYLIEKLMNNTPESQRKQPGKTEGRTCCKADKKPTVAEVTGRSKSEKGTKSTVKMTPEGQKQSNSANSLSSCQTYDVKQELESVGGKEEKDDVSEAGTYTIEKDSSSPEVEQARNDIDRVFGVSGTESEVDVVTPRGNAPTEEAWTPTPESDKFKKKSGQREKSPGSISRSSPNWIRQWAAQVAEHTKSSDASVKTSIGSPRGTKPPLASLSSSQESSESRPRRKLPTPPTHHPPFSMASPKVNDLSDNQSPTKGRQLQELFDSPTLGQRQMDYSRDTESFLRDTEQLVTSLQARIDMNKGIPSSLRGLSFESHDSGGDSDLDTSTSYPINDDDDRLVKTMGSQLKTKLKLAGIDGSPKTPPVATSPRKPDPLAVETRLKLTSHFKREKSIVSDSGYDVYTAGKEENSLQSDSSSEASEPIKDSRKSTDNNPPLKFNRAFSLRRARLACEESSQQHKSPSPVDKKKTTTRPSSAGNLTGSRKIPLTHSKSHQGTSHMSRGGSHSQATTPKSGSNDFSRGDGGRFSLRLPHSTSSTTVSKSPSRTSVRKELSSGTRRGAPRSNSTLSAKEVDFQNWKRRKNYDPMKAAAEGRKKVGDKKSDKLSQGNTHNESERSPSPPGSLLRSASFHGTEGMGVAGRWPRRPNHLYTSEDDGPYSLEEEQPHPVPHCSPLRRSPTSPHQLSSPHTTSPARQVTLSSARARRASYALSDEGEGHIGSPTRKTSLDESGSEGKRSPLGSTRGIVSGRSKAKMEALDNLVISTIHSLSVKVRTTSETLLQKLKSQYDEEGDRAALLEEVLAHLSESDQTLTSGQSRSTSRELAGILRNLKKIEHALEVIDRVMVGIDDDDLDDDDLDGAAGHEWGESDY